MPRVAIHEFWSRIDFHADKQRCVEVAERSGTIVGTAKREAARDLAMKRIFAPSAI